METAVEISMILPICSGGVLPHPHSVATPNSGTTLAAASIILFVLARSLAWTSPR